MKSPKYLRRPKKHKLIHIRRVSGQSMLPTLRDGNYIVGLSVFRRLQPQDIVIIYYSGREMVKRVHNMRSDEIFVVGDNSAMSSDSRSFGWINKDTVIAKVIWPKAVRRKISKEQ